MTGFFFCAIMSTDDMSRYDMYLDDMLRCDIGGKRRRDGGEAEEAELWKRSDDNKMKI